MRIERAAVLAAAIRLLAVNPGASTADIAAAAAISRASLHRLYPSRAALVSAISTLAVERVAAALAHPCLGESPVPEALQQLTDAIVPLVHEFAFLINEAQVHAGAPAVDEAQAIDQVLVRLFRRGQDEGSLRADLPPAWLLHAYRGLLFGVASAAQRGDIAPRDAARLVVSTFLHGAARPLAIHSPFRPTTEDPMSLLQPAQP